MPDDFTHATDARRAEMAAYEATLSELEYVAHIVEDEGLRAVLERMAKARAERKERESAEQAESLPRF